MKKTIQLPAARMEVMLDASTLDLEKRTVEMRWYSGATVQRFSFFDGPYELTFAMEPKNVRLGRLNGGAPLKAGHTFNGEIDSVVGVIEKAWLTNGEGHATVRFSARDEVQPILMDVKDGILRNVSMEAMISKLEDITEKGADQKHFLATDWEPMAVALVAVGADPNAHPLASGETFPCNLSLGAEAPIKETEMLKVRLLATSEIVEIDEEQFDETLHTKQLAPLAPGSDKDEDRQVQDSIEADDKRAGRIREIANHYELDDIWSQRHIKLNSTVKIATADAIKKRAELAPKIDGRLPMGDDYESMGWKGARMTEALYARIFKQECPESARSFARMSIAEIAFEVLKYRNETRGRALDPLRNPADVIQLAMGSSDFPGILANVLNKNLEAAYNQATPTFRLIAQRRNFQDYRPHKFVRLGDFPIPLLVGENGEITQGPVGEGSETVTVLKYGRILAISREALINDNLNAFTDFAGMVARRIIDFENATFYANCIAPAAGLGPTLADGLTVYHATHGNIGIAGVLSNALLGDAFAKMAIQTSIDGLKLNIPPRVVLTSPTSFILARTLLAAIYPSQASNVNPFAGMLDAIYDANVTGVRFYVFADQANGSNYIWGSINGEGPRYAVREGWEVEGIQVKVVADFGCGAIDYRFGFTAAGA